VPDYEPDPNDNQYGEYTPGISEGSTNMNTTYAGPNQDQPDY